MKHKKWKIVLLILMILVLVAGITLFLGLRGKETGRLGKCVFYVFDRKEGTAIIFGFGGMWDFLVGHTEDFLVEGEIAPAEPDPPFYYTGFDSLKKAIVMEGVTELSAQVFERCEAMEVVYLPSTVRDVDMMAFSGSWGLKEVYFSGDAPEFTVGARLRLYRELEGITFEAQNAFVDIYPTIYHKPGSTGWDDPIWEGYTVVEKDFKVDFGPVK